MSTDTDERRELVLEAIVVAGDAGISGQAIADRLGCSRAAVHRHVETLRRSGVGIEGVHEGYRLAASADPIVPRLVQASLTAPILGPVVWSSETGSTNDDMVARARDGAREGLIVGTDFQTTGRGRRGREWRADPGDAILCSVLLRPAVAPAEIGVLPLIAAVAIAEALGQSAGIVWPNDIVIDGNKVCGVLCEMSSDESGVAWVVVGIGINVRGVPRLDGTRWQPGALCDSEVPRSRMEVLIAVLAALCRRYTQWLADGPTAALHAFTERDLLRGAGITVDSGGRVTSGTACGVDEHGRLRVMTESGEIVAGAGEVTRIERG